LDEDTRQIYAEVYHELFNYGVVNRDFGCIEAAYTAFPHAKIIAKDFQRKLDELNKPELKSV